MTDKVIIEQHCGYFRQAFDPDRLVVEAEIALKPVLPNVDLLVGRGLSGAIVVPLLSYVFKKRFAIVRKPEEFSHSGRAFEGLIGTNDRFIFVDDFVLSGATKKAVLDTMVTADMSLWFLGTYEYNYNKFTPV